MDCGQTFSCADCRNPPCIGCMARDYPDRDGLEPMLVTSVCEGEPGLCLHWMARYALMAFQNRNTDYADADGLALDPDGRLVETTAAQVGWTHRPGGKSTVPLGR